MKKKIAIFLNNIPAEGGAFQYNQAVLDAFLLLNDDNFEKIIFYTNVFWKEYLNEKGYPGIKLNYSFRLNRFVIKLLTYLEFTNKFRKLIIQIVSPNTAKHLNDENIDLVFFPSQDTVSLFTSAKKVNVIHDLMHRYESHFKEVSDKGRIKYRDILFSSFCNESLAIIVDSTVGAKHVNEIYQAPMEKIFALPYIPPPHILNNDPVPVDFDAKYNYLPDKFLFYPSQFWSHKNHKNLLLAVDKLRSEGTKVNLVFGGKLMYLYQDIVSLINECHLQDQVTFIDYVPNDYIKGIYLKASGLVMPSFFGPTNIPPLEAIFLGRPVAVSGIYAMPEQLQDAALYFNPKDIDDIADKLKILWSDENQRAQLIENGKKLVKSWNKNEFNRRFKEIINSILD